MKRPAATVQRHHALLREALQHAVKWNLLARNPADFTEPPTPTTPQISPLEAEQLDRLLEFARGHRDEHLITVAAYTGMREGEILALTWADVDLGDEPCCRVNQTVGYINGQGFVFRPVGKSKKARREIPLPQVAVIALQQQAERLPQEKLSAGDDYDDKYNLVFPDKFDRPMDPSGLARRFKRLAKKAGFLKIRFHDLRHTHATMLQQGIHPKIVQERLGHQTIGITMDTYSHVLKGMQKEAVEKLNENQKNKNGHQSGTKNENNPA